MKFCDICGSNHIVEEHHIVKGRGKRKQCETPQSLINLCWEHHHGTQGVHGRDGAALDAKLRKDLQAEYFAMGLTESDTRVLMGGKLLLNDEGEIHK